VFLSVHFVEMLVLVLFKHSFWINSSQIILLGMVTMDHITYIPIDLATSSGISFPLISNSRKYVLCFTRSSKALPPIIPE
jgi:hypothetical protein